MDQLSTFLRLATLPWTLYTIWVFALIAFSVCFGALGYCIFTSILTHQIVGRECEDSGKIMGRGKIMVIVHNPSDMGVSVHDSDKKDKNHGTKSHIFQESRKINTFRG